MQEPTDAQRQARWPEDVVELLRLPTALDSEDREEPASLYPDDGTVTLAQLVKATDGRLTLSQVAGLFRAILDTLESLHELGYVHLQLTPSRVAVRPPNEADGAGLSLEETTADAEDSEQSDEDVGGETTSPGTSANSDALKESTDPMGTDAKTTSTDSDPTLQDLYPLAEEVVADVEEYAPIESEQYLTEPAAQQAEWLDRIVAESNGEENEDDSDSSMASEEPSVRVEGKFASLEEVERNIGRLHQEERGKWRVELIPADGVISKDRVPTDPPTQRGFSSPEVVAGRANATNPESADLFSAGMLLYFLVTGSVPPASVYSRHAPAIPTRNLRFEFPPGLEPVIKRATRPSADERFPDIGAMRNAFDEAVERVRIRHADSSAPKLVAGADRHVGIAKRRRNPVNQDRVFRAVSNDGQFGIVAVADGVSTASYGSGEIASRMFVDAAAEAWDDLLPNYIMEEPEDDAEAVRRILSDANKRIVEWVNERHTPFDGSPHEVMGTTALIALYREGIMTLGSLGDSRAYLQSGPGLEQLSIDHNLWTLSILDGMEADEALSMPQGEALARCLGTFDLEEGSLVPREPDYDVMQCRIAEGDTLLLTTDGLVDFAAGTPVAAEENILATLLSEPNPELACLELILLANRGGGGDNIGLGVLRFE